MFLSFNVLRRISPMASRFAHELNWEKKLLETASRPVTRTVKLSRSSCDTVPVYERYVLWDKSNKVLNLPPESRHSRQCYDGDMADTATTSDQASDL
jgi:hypothetical protein